MREQLRLFAVKLLALLLVHLLVTSGMLFVPTSVLAATLYSCTTGLWRNASTWSATNGGACSAGVPGNGDSAVITNSTTVTVDTNTIVGQSAAMAGGGTIVAGNTAILIGLTPRPASASAKIIVATGVKLTARGNVTVEGASAGRTVGYCPISLAADSEFQFDASQATTPLSQHYLWAPDASNNFIDMDAVWCGTGTAGHPAIFSSNAGGGNAYASQNGGSWNGFYHNLVYTDIKSIGDASNPSLLMDAYGTNLSSEVSTLDHVRSYSSGRVEYSHGNSADFALVTNYQCIAPLGDGCFNNASAAPATGTKTFTKNSNDSGLMFASSGGFSIDGWTMDKNYLYGQVNWLKSSTQWLSNNKNVIVRPSQVATGLFGPASNDYLLMHLDSDNMHGYQPEFGVGSTLAFTGLIFDDDAYSATIADTGDLILDFNVTHTLALTVSGAISLPGADPAHNSPGILLNMENNAGLAATMTNNTVYDMTQTVNQGVAGFEVGGTGVTGNVAVMKGNIVYSIPTSTAALMFDPHNASCITDTLTPSGAGYNGIYHVSPVLTGTCRANAGTAYAANFSVTPPGVGADVSSNPNFVDDNRGLVQAGVGLFGEAVAAAWVTSTSYVVGNIISVTDANYYRGLPINYTAIAAHTSSATNKPGKQDGTWRASWEPTGFADYRAALYAGTTYTVPNCASCAVYDAFLAWARNGMAPQNSAYVNASAPSGFIGAVAPLIASGGSIVFLGAGAAALQHIP